MELRMVGFSKQAWRQLIFPPIDFRQQRYAEHRAASILMTAVTALAGTSLWMWDYAYDPSGADGTMWLRLAIPPTSAPYLAALILSSHRRFAALAAAVAFAGWEWGFIEILNRLRDGMTYGLAGFMYFLMMPLLMTRGLSFITNVALTIGIALFPAVVFAVGLAPGFPVGKYAVLIAPAASMCLFAAFVFSQSYSENWHYRRSLERAARTDALTGLGNRRRFVELIEVETERNRDGHRSVGVLTLDLDHFKRVNDTFGHAAGDELLREVARRLHKCLRADDVIMRLGGDEFAILLPNMSEEDGLAEVAGRILLAIAAPVNHCNQEIIISASVGISRFPADSDDFHQILKNADAAMYKAKSIGRNNYQFYDAEIMADAVKRMMIEATLRKALPRNEFELYYQPQVSLPSGRVIGAEALLRWHHPDLGCLTPDRFISVAEESGMIVDIGRWVIECACHTAVQWNRNSDEPLTVSANVSSRQVTHGDLAIVVADALAATGCSPRWLCLEITETLLLEDSRNVKTTFDTIKKMGVSIALDDFGTGYSALSYLSHFPIDVLKIDQSFVRGLGSDNRKTELVRAIIGIAKALDLKLVAEGVETQNQSKILQANDCMIVQGYLYGKPMPKKTFSQVLLATDEEGLCA